VLADEQGVALRVWEARIPCRRRKAEAHPALVLRAVAAGFPGRPGRWEACVRAMLHV